MYSVDALWKRELSWYSILLTKYDQLGPHKTKMAMAMIEAPN